MISAINLVSGVLSTVPFLSVLINKLDTKSLLKKNEVDTSVIDEFIEKNSAENVPTLSDYESTVVDNSKITDFSFDFSNQNYFDKKFSYGSFNNDSKDNDKNLVAVGSGSVVLSSFLSTAQNVLHDYWYLKIVLFGVIGGLIIKLLKKEN